MTGIVEAQNLKKSYGKQRAVEDVSFSIAEGEIFGLSISGGFFLLLGMLLSAFVFAFMGLLISVAVREVFEAMTLSNFFRLPMVFLCGVFFPFESLPKVLQIVGFSCR